MKRNSGVGAVLTGVGALALVGWAVMAQVLEVALLEERPAWGNFYSLQKANDPPLPFNPWPELPLYWLGDRFYAVDDRTVDYVALAQEAELVRLLSLEMGLDGGPPELPGEGEGGTNGPPWSGSESLSYTGLCLYPPVLTGSNTVVLVLTNGEANAQYDLFLTTNLVELALPALSLTNWVWLERGLPGQTNFIVANPPRPESYFALGTMEDTDEDGLPDAYERLVSHTDPGSASNPDTDGDGMPDAWELAHGLNPCNPADASGDPDDDGLTNGQEYVAGTNPFDPMLLVWSKDGSAQTVVPWDVPGPVTMAGGGGGGWGGHTLMVTGQGEVWAWGANGWGQTNVPGGIGTNAIAVAAGGDQSAALLRDGTVTTWGRLFDSVPAGLTNVTAISAGYQHLLALRADGTVATWGHSNSPANAVPVGLSNGKAIAAGWNHNLVLRSNGTVAVWGVDSAELGWNLTSHAPTNLSDIAAIAAGALHSVVLRSNGTLVAWGYNQGGETNVPAGLSNVTAIAAGRGYTLALLSDETVTGWGVGLPPVPPGLTGVKAIAAGPGHALATRQGVLTPLILRQPKSQGAAAGGSVTFSVTAASRREPAYQWQFNGADIAGGTHSGLTLTNVEASTQGGYRVHVSNGAGSAFSEEAAFVLALPPEIISPTNAQLVWVPQGSNTALTVEATAQGSQYVPLHYNWYRDGVPLGELDMENLTLWQMGLGQEGNYWAVVTNIAGAATSAVWTVRTLIPGGVGAWGDLSHGLPPSGLTNCIGLRAGQNHVVALTEAGTVVAWGENAHGQATVPDGLTNTVEVAAGAEHTLALREDGTVVAWGRNQAGQTSVPGDLTNATAIAAGGAHNIALLADGSVRTWGENIGTAPAGLTDVMAVAAGLDFNVALRANGSVTAWGGNNNGQTNVPAGLSNVVGIAAGEQHALALRSDGRVVAWGANTHGQTNAPATLTNAMAVAAGAQFSLALRNDGTVVAWGDNAQGQTNALTNLPPVKLIAAGGAQALAALFSPLVQYPVDVSQDLLLIYNTNSAASIFVKDYYLTHRPMVGNANVLGLGVPGIFVAHGTNSWGWQVVTNTWVYETVTQATFTNCILNPVRGWLDENPTKRPQYVVLFLDIPSRVNDSATNAQGYAFYYNALRSHSVSYQLAESLSDWSPFITHINMGSSNACRAYIDKLAFIAGNSPGLLISANSINYGNTNYYFDDNLGGSMGSNAQQGVLAAGVDPSCVIYGGASSSILSSASNVAGYLCWGQHDGMGGDYARNGLVNFTGQSGWYIIQTIESFNGQQFQKDQGNFVDWFSSEAFGGNEYSNTPVGAVSHVDEPKLPGANHSATYFGLWARGRNFAICA